MSNAPTALIALTALTALTASVVAAQTTHALVVSGVAGEPRLAQQFQRDGAAIRDAVVRRFGGQAGFLSESSTPRSDKAGITRALQTLTAQTKPGDRVLIVLIGHGSAQSAEARFNIPGPDLTAAELARLLEPLKARDIAIVIATSASGAFVPALSAPGRTIVSATRSGSENEEIVFPQYFAQALSEDVADADKDGGVSLVEAFDYAKREVGRFYQQHNRLATEHALLDDNGDGKGSLALEAGGDGQLAKRFVLRAVSSKGASPELRALYEQRDSIQRRIDDLKARKSSLTQAAYDTEMEKLLLELARKSQEIRAVERKT
jgi:hypothetical protein